MADGKTGTRSRQRTAPKAEAQGGFEDVEASAILDPEVVDAVVKEAELWLKHRKAVAEAKLFAKAAKAIRSALPPFETKKRVRIAKPDGTVLLVVECTQNSRDGYNVKPGVTQRRAIKVPDA